MPVQKRNAELVDLLRADFQARAEANFAASRIISMILNGPRLRGFWPMSSVDENNDVYDLTGQGRTLTVNGAAPGIGSAPGLLYVWLSLNGANNLYRTDEPGLNRSGDMSCGAWVRFDNAPAAVEVIMGKHGSNAANSDWYLYRAASGVISFTVSNGAAFTTVSTVGTLAANVWAFVGARRLSTTQLEVHLNSEFVDAGAGPAGINTITNPFALGAFYNESAVAYQGFMTGDIAYPFWGTGGNQPGFLQMIYQESRAMFGV